MNKILLTAINFLIAIGVLFVLVLPKNKALHELNSQIEVKKIEIQTQENYFKNLQDLSKKLAAFPDEVSKINSALPSTPSLYSLIYFLQKTSSASGLIIKQIDFGEISKLKENSNIKSIPISLGVMGSYQSLKNFLLDIEKSARIIEIDNLSFTYPGKTEKEGYNFNLEFKAHSY